MFLWRERHPPAGHEKPKRDSPSPNKGLNSIFGALALSIVVGLLAALTLAQAVQWRWFEDDFHHLGCRDVAVAQATMAVRDLSATMPRTDGASGTGASSTPLSTLVQKTLVGGTKYLDRNISENDSLGGAFQNAYEDAIGGCLAGEAFETLWWVGVPLAVLTLFWWRPELPQEVRQWFSMLGKRLARARSRGL